MEYLEAFSQICLFLPSTIKNKITQIQFAIKAFNNQSYPKKALPYLPLSESDVIELIRLNWSGTSHEELLEKEISKLDHLLCNFRYVVWQNLGIYAILNELLLDEIIKMNFIVSPILELASGNGFLASRLSYRKLEVSAVDNGEYIKDTPSDNSYYPIIKDDAVSYLNKNITNFSTIILCWSPDNDLLDLKVLQKIRSQDKSLRFLVIGERKGKTNSAEFWKTAHFTKLHQMLKLNRYFSDFDLYHDRIYFIE